MRGHGDFSDVQAAPIARRRFLQSLAIGLGASALCGRSQGSLIVDLQRAVPADLPTALIYDDFSKQHTPGPHRLECPQRYDAVLKGLRESRCFSALLPLQSRPATDNEVLACHSGKYLTRIRREIESGVKRLSTGDTWVCRKSLKAAYYAGGAACVAVDAVLGGKAKNTFCLTRPPGHHATISRGMGFCVLNNAAIAARYAQRKHRVGKVLIVDWDVHHGNGTQEIFYEDPSVFYFSTHQSPWYPWTGSKEETGRGKGLGTTLNCPLKRGSGRREYLTVFNDRLGPAVGSFKPELIIISAGFDAQRGDPLGRMELLEVDYRDLTGLVLEMARQSAQGRMISILEGGYKLDGLAGAAVAHCERLQQG